jgi:hypothetical protein
MRALFVFAVVMLVGCSVDNDPAEDQVTVKYDEAKVKKSAATAARAAKEVATGVAHVAKDTGRSIKREVGDVDVDVNVSRARKDEAAPTATSS